MIRQLFAALTLAATAIALPAARRHGRRRGPPHGPDHTCAGSGHAGAREPSPVEVAPRETPGQPINIKLEITITDQGAPGEPSRKTVSMVVADRAVGSVRTAGTQIMTATGPQPLLINVDATPTDS